MRGIEFLTSTSVRNEGEEGEKGLLRRWREENRRRKVQAFYLRGKLWGGQIPREAAR